MSTSLSLIRAPQPWPPHHKDRRVTWLELFFDLIFVAAIAQVGIPLQADYSWAGLLRYSFLFVLIWLAWSGHSLYCSRFDSDDLLQRVLLVVQCFLAAVMAANAKESLDSRSAAGFGAAYAGIRLVLAMQYGRLMRAKETRAFAVWSGTGITLSALVWGASAIAPIPLRYVLWSVALAGDLAVPWVARRHGNRFPPHSGHFPERVGLFTIILVGEYVASVMRGIESQEEWSVPAASTAIMGIVGGFLIFWCYFDYARAADHRHTKTGSERRSFLIWYGAHLPLGISVAVLGIGIEHLIGPMPLTREALTISGLALSIVCLALWVLAWSRGSGVAGAKSGRGQADARG